AAVVRGYGGRWHDGCGVVPAKGSGGLLHRQIAGEVQHPAARPVERIAENAVVDVAVRSHHGGGAADVEHAGIVDAAVPRVEQVHLELRCQRCAVEAHQVGEEFREWAAHGHVQGLTVIA